MRAMILAAGRGTRMQPLTDACPKPLLRVGGKPLIVWHIERIAAAGVCDIVINTAHLPEQFPVALGTGERWGVRLHYSVEAQALETAGGIAKALPLLGEEPFIVVSADIFTDFDYRSLLSLSPPAAHLVLVPNPDFHPSGDMGLVDGVIAPNQLPRLTYGNIGVFNPLIFKSLSPSQPQKLFPWLYAQGQLTGELYQGVWHNLGTPEQLAALNQTLTHT